MSGHDWDMQPELILDARADLGEGPAWESRTGRLYWVDIHARNLHIFNPQDATDLRIEVGEFIGCAAPRRANGLVLGLRSGFAILDSPLLAKQPRRGQGEAGVRTIVNPEPHLPGNRFNDGKCDPAGRFLAGHLAAAAPSAG